MGYSFKKDPHGKKKIFAIFILILFVGSSLAIAVIDAVSFGGTREDQKLPEKVSYSDISPELKQAMIQNYYMIIEYTYPEGCSDCNSTVASLGAFAQDKIDVYVIALEGTSESIVMYNAQREVELNSTSTEELLSSYCDITYNTYSECALRRI